MKIERVDILGDKETKKGTKVPLPCLKCESLGMKLGD